MPDENALPIQTAAAKLAHQRNKSTPAVTGLMQHAAVRPVAQAKRAAMTDLSNTSRQGHTTESQSLKVSSDGSQLVPTRAPQDASTKLLSSKTIQRPLSVKTTSSQPAVAVAVTSTSGLVAAPKLSAPEPAVPRLVPAQIRSRTLIRNPGSTARGTLDVIAEAQVPLTTDIHIDDVLHQEGNDYPFTTIRSNQHKLSAVPIRAHVSAVVPSQPTLLSQSSQAYPDYNHAQTAEQLLEQQAQAIDIDRNGNAALAQSVSPPDYYHDEQDDLDQETGYSTLRSLKLKGDTTVVATLVVPPKYTASVIEEISQAREIVESSRTIEDLDDESWDTSMVAEYGEEIFAYMRTLEERMRPNPHYMDHQTECQWSMRAVLMDWLIQVHQRFGLLPETLFLSVNYIDRFLSSKVVSLAKLQLVGATAIFLASKYEEVNCPSIAEIVYMVDNGYTADEILKAERFMLSMLTFELGWPGPMSFLRRISKADDYDLETRTLAKYFLEVTIMDERFVGCAPSFTAAGAHCLARLMLRKGEWTPGHVYYSDYTYSQLHRLLTAMVECCEEPKKHHGIVFEKYQDKRFKRASIFVQGEIQNGFQLPAVSRKTSLGYVDSVHGQ